MNFRIIRIIISVFALCTQVLHGQQILNLSLKAAVDSALNNNIKIQQYKQVVLQKQYLSKAALGNFFPSVDIVGGYTYFSKNPEINMSQVKSSIDDLFGKYGVVIAQELDLSQEDQKVIYDKIVGGLGKLPAYNITVEQQNYPNLNVTAMQPIFLGGKIIAGKRFAEAEQHYASMDLQQVTNRVIKETIERYFGVVLLNEVITTRKQVVAGMLKHERQAEKAIEVGVIPPHELLRAQVAVANAQRDLSDDENKLELAKMALNTSLGLSNNTEIVASDSLKFKIVPVNLNDLQLQARQTQPIFGMIDQKKLMVDQQHALDVSEFMPQVAAWGEYGFFRDQYAVIMPPAMIGIQAHINIFHGMSKVNKLKSTKYLLEEVSKARTYAEDQVNLWVDKSYREVLNSSERYRKMKPTVALAAKNYKINEKRFQEGLSKSIDVIDSRLLYEGVQLERLKSLYDYYIALSELYLETGNPQKVIEMLNN
jgi:outer membrane protein TolC